MSNFGPLFYQADQRYNLRPGTTGAIGYIESRYNPNAVSPSGAQGLMQFMPATAKGMGLANPFDAPSAIDAGAHLFRQNLDASNGDYRQAAMMYHGGPNQSIWGPKTNAYGDNFVARLNNVQPGGPPVAPRPSLAALNAAPADVSMSAQPMQAASLGALGGLPQGQIPAKSQSKFTAGNVLGVLGDALMAYGGMQPQFGPFMREQQMKGQQQNFEREKFNTELQMRMYQMLHPEEMMKAMAFQNADQGTRQSMIDYENQMHPNVVSAQQPNGAFSNQIIPRQLVPHVGDVVDGRPYLGGDPSNPNSWGEKR